MVALLGFLDQGTCVSSPLQVLGDVGPEDPLSTWSLFMRVGSLAPAKVRSLDMLVLRVRLLTPLEWLKYVF